MWTTTKVNWKSVDYYNIEDWQRVRSNLEHVYDWLKTLGLDCPPLLETDTGRGYMGLPYVHLVNNMEENLASLMSTLGIDFTEDVPKKTWYARLDAMYSSNPSYKDWNRWELILQRVYESIQYVETYVFKPISGTCRSGSERTLLRFSRGR